jgi:hypothetical protein
MLARFHIPLIPHFSSYFTTLFAAFVCKDPLTAEEVYEKSSQKWENLSKESAGRH